MDFLRTSVREFFQTFLSTKRHFFAYCFVFLACLELAFIEFLVETVFLKKRIVTALLDDISVFHNENTIRILYGGKSVRYNKSGSAFQHFLKSALYFLFRSGIDGACCLIQYQNSRIHQHHSCNAKQLLLSLRKISAVLGKNGIVAFRKLHDKMMTVRPLAGLFNLFQGSILFTVTNVFENGIGL